MTKEQLNEIWEKGSIYYEPSTMEKRLITTVVKNYPRKKKKSVKKTMCKFFSLNEDNQRIIAKHLERN